jgi:hypothetical protein
MSFPRVSCTGFTQHGHYHLSAPYILMINLTPMKKLFTLFVCTVFITAVSATNILTAPAAPDSLTSLPVADSTPVKTYHYEVFKQPDNSFGYDIYSGAKKVIHQPNIPGQPGSKGFVTKDAATKVAGFVVNKLQKNIFPPTISTEELKQLRVL